MPQVFCNHGQWGNHISFDNWQQRSVSGHLTPAPEVGDFLEHRMRSGKIAVFRFIRVSRNTRVPDYFEATVSDLGYKKDLPENYYDVLKAPEKLVPSWVFWLLVASSALTWAFVHYNLR